MLWPMEESKKVKGVAPPAEGRRTATSEEER